jgi:hypothetical protein
VTVYGVTTPSENESAPPPGQAVSFQKNGGNFYTAPGFIPMRATFRGSLATYFDAGVDFGLAQTGLMVRGGPLDARRALPWGIQLEWRGPGPVDDLNRRTNLGSARLELYPHISDHDIFDGYVVLAAGASFGQQYQVVTIPDAYDPSGVEEYGPNTLELVPTETRIESAFGATFFVTKARITAVLMPYYVVDRGGLEAWHGTEGSLDVTDSHTNDFGFSLMLSLGAAFEKKPKQYGLAR